MAEATRTEKVITSTEAVYTLAMTQEEYDFLKGVVGGRTPTPVGMRVYDALFSPKNVPAEDAEPPTFDHGDTVTVLVGAKSASGGDTGQSGPARVHSYGADDDGDYWVRFADGTGDYVLAQYLRKR